MVAWILSLITSVAPLSAPSYYPDARESVVERQARYESIAKDVLAVVYDTNEAPLFKGPTGRAQTADVILAIASFESGFRKDVDLGLGAYSKGDGGRSWCQMQIQLGQATAGGNTAMRINLLPDGSYEFTTDRTKGYGGLDLVSNRKACFRAGLHIIRSSMAACGSLPLKSKLRAYASGSCDKGEVESAARMGRAMRWMSEKAPSFTDDQAFAWLASPTPPPVALVPSDTALVVSNP